MFNESFDFIFPSEYDNINSEKIDIEDNSLLSNESEHSNCISTKKLVFEHKTSLAESQENNDLNNNSKDEHKNVSSEISLHFYSTFRQNSTDLTNKNKLLHKKRKNPHNTLSSDNLLRKVQIHYFSFLISFLNFLLKYFKFDYTFLQLDYNIKRNINKDENKRKIVIENENIIIFNSFNDITVEKIISQKKSNKYKLYDENHNQNICEAVKRNKIMYNILNDNHLNIFKKFYFTSIKLINLKEYGLDIYIKLPNDIETHFDLLKKNFDFEYRRCINNCILKNYFPKSKFLFY